MTEIGNKFIFTTEGRTSLVAQLGGIRFSVLGAILIQGLKPVEKENDESGIDFQERFEEAFANLTLDSLSLDNGVVLGLKNVDYNATGGQKIYPVELDKYQGAVNNITQNLIPLHYVPAQELEDNIGNVYGIYELDVDKTLLACNFIGSDSDVSFAHIGLIGKQYTQTDDATYNIDHTQKPILVGIAQLDGEYDEKTNVYAGGIQLLAEQNQYVNVKLKLRFTLDERDRDVALDIDVDNQQTKEILDISNKLSLVNNGLKNKTKEGIKVASDKTIIENFNLNKEGALATDKTLMVAQKFGADELENQWNGVGLIHLINRENQEDDDENPYTPQVVLSTIEHYENLETDPVVSYNVMMLLQGKGKEISVDYESKYAADVKNSILAIGSDELIALDGYGFKASGSEVPKFVMSMKPEYDNIAVDIFGLDNKIVDENNTDKFLFSKNNFSYSSRTDVSYDTVVFGAGDNYLEGNAGNVLINAGKNVLRNNSKYNTLENSWNNIIQCNGQESVLINSNNNAINIHGFIDKYKDNTGFYNCTLINSDTNIIENLSVGVLINAHYNTINTGVPDSDGNRLYNLNIIGGRDNVVVHGADNLYLMCSNTFIDNSSDTSTTKINERTLILGNRANWNPVEWPSRPGILYGNGTSHGDAINALEFFPDEGLLKLYNKDHLNTVTIGGDAGIEFPGSVMQTIEMTMKSLNVTDKISLGHDGSSQILLDTTVDDPYISLKNNDDTNPAETTIEPGIIELHSNDEKNKSIINSTQWSIYSDNGIELSKISKSEWSIRSDDGKERSNILPSRWSIISADKSVMINPGHVAIVENGTLIDITADTSYQKVTADIIIQPSEDSSYRCYTASVKNAHGNVLAVNWLKKLWEKYTPVAYGDPDDEAQANLNYASILSEGKRTLLDFNTNNTDLRPHFDRIINSFETYKYMLSNGINATLKKYPDDNSKLFYYSTPLPSYFSCIDEVELNIYVGDAAGSDISLVWLLGTILNPIYPYKAPTFKLNFILDCHEVVGNGAENLHVYTHKVYSDKTLSDSEHIEQKKLSLDYKNYVTLLGKPANFTDPEKQLTELPGYMAWRVITQG